MLRSITPTRARRPFDASVDQVDQTDARCQTEKLSGPRSAAPPRPMLTGKRRTRPGPGCCNAVVGQLSVCHRRVHQRVV